MPTKNEIIHELRRYGVRFNPNKKKSDLEKLLTEFLSKPKDPPTEPPESPFDEDGIPDAFDNCPAAPNPLQEDTYPPQGNNIGDASDCESDFNCDGAVSSDDMDTFTHYFGRNIFGTPCTRGDPCKGDYNCDGNVVADDVAKLLEDFGRSEFYYPCPVCEVGPWCSYP